MTSWTTLLYPNSHHIHVESIPSAPPPQYIRNQAVPHVRVLQANQRYSPLHEKKTKRNTEENVTILILNTQNVYPADYLASDMKTESK